MKSTKKKLAKLDRLHRYSRSQAAKAGMASVSIRIVQPNGIVRDIKFLSAAWKIDWENQIVEAFPSLDGMRNFEPTGIFCVSALFSACIRKQGKAE